MVNLTSQQLVQIDSIKPHPRNYRKHPEDQLKHIVKSIQENGFYRNIVISQDDYILAGHGVVLAAKSMGITEVPVIRIDLNHLDERAIKIMTGDNEIAHLGQADDRLLAELLKQVQENSDLLGTGYNEEMLSNLIFLTRKPDETDPNAEWQGMPEYNNENKNSWKALVVHFDNEQDMEAFSKLVEQPVAKATRFIWYPKRDREDKESKRY